MEICNYLIEHKLNINYEELFKQIANIPYVNREIILKIYNNSGLEVNNRTFLPLLYPAIHSQNVNLVDFLLERNIFYEDCLIDAASSCNLDMVNTILKYKSNSFFINRGSKNGTALHISVQKNDLKIVKKLLSLPSINPYLYDNNNRTPLMVAANQMSFSIIKEFLSFSGKNILSHRDSIDCLFESLIQRINTSNNNNNHNNNYNYYNHNNYNNTSNDNAICIEILEMLLNIEDIKKIFDDKNQRFFINICSKKDIDIKIIQKFLDMDTIDINAYSNSNNNTPLISALKTQRIDIFNLLINHPRIDINASNGNRETALHHAVMMDNLEIVKKLLSFPSINPYLYDRNNKTPLMIAANQMRFSIIKEFLSFSGKNILSHRVSIDCLFESLIQRINTSNNNNNYNNNYNYYNRNNGFNHQNNQDLLSQNDNIFKTLEFLLQIEGINEIFNEKNQNFFLNICSKRNIDAKFAEIFLNIDTIDVNYCSALNGNTPLISALTYQNIEIAELLIKDPRTNINITNFNHESALIIAVKNQLVSIVNLLIHNERFDPIESHAEYAFVISKDEISEILLSMNIFDVNCIIVDPQQNKNRSWGTSQGSSWGTSQRSTWGTSQGSSWGKCNSNQKEETALTQAAKNQNLKKMQNIFNHPTFDKDKSNLRKAVQIIFNSSNGDIQDEFLEILHKNKLIDYCFQDQELLFKLLPNDYAQKIIQDNYIISDENILGLFSKALNPNKNSIKIMNFLINYDKKYHNIIDFKENSFLTRINRESTWGCKNTKTNNYVEEIVNLIIQNGGDVNQPDKNDFYPLEFAIRNYNLDLISALLKTGKINYNQKIIISNRSTWGNDFNEHNIDDRLNKKNVGTYLHLAANTFQSKPLKMLLNLNVFDINAKDSDNETPLMIACRNIYEKNVMLLVDKGADFRCRNNQNEDAIQIVQNLCMNKNGKEKESKDLNVSSDSLSKEEYLSKLFALLKEINQEYHYYDDIDIYSEEEESNDHRW